MDAPANEEPHFKWLAVLTRLTILTEQRKIKTISFIQHLKPVASNMTATQEKILQDFFTTKPENRMVTAAPPPPIPYCIVKAQHSPIGISGSFTYLHQQRIWLQLKNLFVLHSPDFENCSVHV